MPPAKFTVFPALSKTEIPTLNAKIQLTVIEAVQLHNQIGAMTGSVSYQAERKQVCENILDLFPESKSSEAIVSADKEEKRSLELTPRQQRAIAEGLLAQMSGVSLRDFLFLESLAKVCRMSKWINSKIGEQKPVDDFDGELDGEPDVVEDVSAQT